MVNERASSLDAIAWKPTRMVSCWPGGSRPETGASVKSSLPGSRSSPPVVTSTRSSARIAQRSGIAERE